MSWHDESELGIMLQPHKGQKQAKQGVLVSIKLVLMFCLIFWFSGFLRVRAEHIPSLY